MPCRCDYLEPSKRETTSLAVKGFLREIGAPTGPFDNNYGDVSTLDADTRTLCTWCRANDVSTKSLEFQIWWRDHKEADAARAIEEERVKQLASTRKAGLGKLTNAEKRALGLKDDANG